MTNRVTIMKPNRLLRQCICGSEQQNKCRRILRWDDKTVILQTVSLSIILVSYNTVGMTLQCLRCIYDSQNLSDFEVFLVDNNSHDDTVEAVGAQFSDVRIIANKENIGFGQANNQAFALCNGEYILLLNTDAFVEPTCIQRLVDYLQANPTVAVVGPRVLNTDQTPQTAAWPFPSPAISLVEYWGLGGFFPRNHAISGYRKWDHNNTCSVPWLIGACLLIRKATLDSIGGFDEQFFMYAEETDLQKRIRDTGADIHLNSEATVTHLGGGSGSNDSSAVRRYFYDSQDRYMFKHYKLSGFILNRLFFGVGSCVRFLGWGAVSLLFRSQRKTSIVKLRLYAFTAYRSFFLWRLH